MFSTLRNRFGIPGVISVIALVFAMIGGAYAASNSSDGKGATASAKKKAKKGPTGPKGPKGATGAAGPAGSAGPAGAKGDAGAAGEKGATGPEGSQGPTGEKGAQGEKGSKGAEGDEGPEGSPWTASGTLPTGATQTGTWFLTSESSVLGGATWFTSIDFAIPLATALDETKALYVKSSSEVPAECDDGEGTAPSYAHPEADDGYLCVFRNESSLLTTNPMVLIVGTGFGALGTDTTGALLATPENPGVGVGGSFAVTGG